MATLYSFPCVHDTTTGHCSTRARMFYFVSTTFFFLMGILRCVRCTKGLGCILSFSTGGVGIESSASMATFWWRTPNGVAWSDFLAQRGIYRFIAKAYTKALKGWRTMAASKWPGLQDFTNGLFSRTVRRSGWMDVKLCEVFRF
jgi:hypothetical protein